MAMDNPTASELDEVEVRHIDYFLSKTIKRGLAVI